MDRRSSLRLADRTICGPVWHNHGPFEWRHVGAGVGLLPIRTRAASATRLSGEALSGNSLGRFTMESKAKLLGHPIHPMLITFPLGLLGMGVIFDLIGVI